MHRNGGAEPFLGHMHHAGHPFFWLLVLVVLAGICFFAVRAFLTASGQARNAFVAAPGHDPALASVRLRYARGEIDRDEFARVSTDLGMPPPLAS